MSDTMTELAKQTLAEQHARIETLERQNAALAAEVARLRGELDEARLVAIVAADDGLCFNEPIGSIAGTISIREWSADNSLWEDYPCEFVARDGWHYPIVTDEIRAALEAALVHGTDEQFARFAEWRKENPDPFPDELAAAHAALDGAVEREQLQYINPSQPATPIPLTLRERIERLKAERDAIDGQYDQVAALLGVAAPIDHDATLDRVAALRARCTTLEGLLGKLYAVTRDLDMKLSWVRTEMRHTGGKIDHRRWLDVVSDNDDQCREFCGFMLEVKAQIDAALAGGGK
jgi:hypothetical protein